MHYCSSITVHCTDPSWQMRRRGEGMMWRKRRNERYDCFDPIVPQNPRPRHLVYCSCEMKKALLPPLAYNRSLSFVSAPVKTNCAMCL